MDNLEIGCEGVDSGQHDGKTFGSIKGDIFLGQLRNYESLIYSVPWK
jgi:hypothetical protein